MLDEVTGLVDAAVSRARGRRPAAARGGFGAWQRGVCPLCGGEPDFACITTAGERLLICGRCQTRWPTEQLCVSVLRRGRQAAHHQLRDPGRHLSRDRLSVMSSLSEDPRRPARRPRRCCPQSTRSPRCRSTRSSCRRDFATAEARASQKFENAVEAGKFKTRGSDDLRWVLHCGSC